jgi:RHS repeat-associated protein
MCEKYDGLPNVTNGPNPPTKVLGFNGQLLDVATGLYDLRARLYDPGLGRFLQSDPVPATPSKPYVAAYPYGDDQPTVLTDPTGMAPLPPTAQHTNGSSNLFADWWAGVKELYADWKAGPVAPKILGGAMIAVSGGAVACYFAVAACAAALSSPLASQCLQSAGPDLQQFLAEAQANNPILIAGGNSGTVFRDATLWAEQYGGVAADYLKYVSRQVFTVNGVQVQLHWVENIVTGATYDLKLVG